VRGAHEVCVKAAAALAHKTNTHAGNMPHLMPSGQDFFTQLKKQLASLEKSS